MNKPERQRLSDDEQRLLAREIAADSFEPPAVADIADVLRTPRESFVAGWDAAIAYLRTQAPQNNGTDETLGLTAVLGKPTRWRDFVETLNVERF